MWQDEEKRAQIVAAITEAMASEVLRAKLSAHAKALWEDPAFRAKYAPDHHVRMAQKLWSDPETTVLASRKNRPAVER